MSIDINTLSAKELESLISKAKKRKTTLSKRKPLAQVRKKLTQLARNEGYTISELFGSGGAVRPRRRASRWARWRRSIAIPTIRKKPGPAVASSRAGWRPRPAKATASKTS